MVQIGAVLLGNLCISGSFASFCSGIFFRSFGVCPADTGDVILFVFGRGMIISPDEWLMSKRQGCPRP